MELMRYCHQSSRGNFYRRGYHSLLTAVPTAYIMSSILALLPKVRNLSRLVVEHLEDDAADN